MRFFGVALHAVRIGGSPAAPLFEVVAKPNDWQKRVRSTTARPVGTREVAHERFWAALLEELRERSPQIVAPAATASSTNYLSFRSAVPNATTYAVFGQGHVRVELYIDAQDPERNRETFDGLLAHRDGIEAQFGGPIEFDPCEGRQICKLVVKRDTPNGAVLVPEVHDELRRWFADTLVRFVPAFRAGEADDRPWLERRADRRPGPS